MVDQIYFEEERIPMIPVGVNLKCNVCGDGYLEAINPNDTPRVSSTLAIYPPPVPTYEHICTNDKCVNRAYFEDVFPRIEYDDLENHLELIG